MHQLILFITANTNPGNKCHATPQLKKQVTITNNFDHWPEFYCYKDIYLPNGIDRKMFCILCTWNVLDTDTCAIHS